MSKKPIAFEEYSDGALVELMRSDSDKLDDAFAAICARYMRLIAAISSSYRKCSEGYEVSDFIQEGLIGLLSACKSYDKNGGTSFKNYAMLCVENRFRSILRHQNSKTKIPPNNIVPIDETNSYLEDFNAMSMQEALESKEYIKSVYKKIENTLSPLEKSVMSLYLSGYSYKQCAFALDITEKAVDNALCRIRKKLSK